MRDGQSNTTYLADYRPPTHLIDGTALDIRIYADRTEVSSRLRVRRNPDAEPSASLRLNGEQLQLQSIAIDRRELTAGEYKLTDSELCLHDTPADFELSCDTVLDPAKNLSLEGLYLSDGMVCTQCEAEGFRRITYYLDRPDVMSVFTVRIEAEVADYPVLLSNGNETGRGDVPASHPGQASGRHWVQWHDPHKKPAYLFALVAGDLAVVEDQLTTVSGRDVLLQIYVEAKDLNKTAHAMMSLKNAMRWDERVYGREYDLDRYMIVAVDFFNMGAMENKGLNIFNTSCVLAHPQTQSDQAFQRVEAVIAHEYFHNWSGNRVTCRDWFQLSLKEGFTVFRDAQFSADMNSPTVKRIEDVGVLRSAQFAEDAGPMAHPVRPDAYLEISNFYTVTIYEKGAEVIRMMRQILGAEAFRRGSDLYFSRHDGQAVTCEDFVVAMEDASTVDLQQFRRWYTQAGTPVLQVTDHWDAASQKYDLTIVQSCPSTPGQDSKDPFHIPLSIALLKPDSNALSKPKPALDSSHYSLVLDDRVGEEHQRQQGDCQRLLAVTKREQTFRFTGISEKPVPSLLREFSAPVRLYYDYSIDDLLLLLRADDDGFVRWDASRRLVLALITAQLESGASCRENASTDSGDANCAAYCDALASLLAIDVLDDPTTDLALLAEIVRLPSYAFLVDQLEQVDMAQLETASQSVHDAIRHQLHPAFLTAYRHLDARLQALGAYRPDADAIALRSLKNTLLSYVCDADDEGVLLAQAQFDNADNMTDRASALAALVNASSDVAADHARACLEVFFSQYADESLVVNQWFSVQAGSRRADCYERVVALQSHPAYDATNPNKVRALIGAFCMRNLPQFHRRDGAGYRLLADEVLRLDSINPQLAARLLTPLTQWQKYADGYRAGMCTQLERIAAAPVLSTDVYEVVSKSLALPA